MLAYKPDDEPSVVENWIAKSSDAAEGMFFDIVQVMRENAEEWQSPRYELLDNRNWCDGLHVLRFDVDEPESEEGRLSHYRVLGIEVDIYYIIVLIGKKDLDDPGPRFYEEHCWRAKQVTHDLGQRIEDLTDELPF